MPFQRLFFYTLYRLLVQKNLSSSLNLSAARLEREMYQMIQVSFAWQTWWRLPILMVGSGSKEKTPVCCTLALLTKISTIHPEPRIAGISKEVKMHEKFEFVWSWFQWCFFLGTWAHHQDSQAPPSLPSKRILYHPVHLPFKMFSRQI